MPKAKPDPVLCRDQLAALQGYLHAYGALAFMSGMFWILTKKAEDFAGRVTPTRTIPFSVNRIQTHLDGELANWNYLLKSRQVGGTTYFILRRLMLPIVTEGGIGSMLISQSSDFATEHFAMVQRAYELIGVEDPHNLEANTLNISLKQNLLHTKYSNRREIVFDQLDSKIRIASAEVEESGQGVTLHHVLASEYSRWPGKPAETLSNIMGALVPGGTRDIECTANGAAGDFYEEFKQAVLAPHTSAGKAHFYPWPWSDEYELTLSPKEAQELAADLTSDELQLIKRMHIELRDVAYAAT